MNITKFNVIQCVNLVVSFCRFYMNISDDFFKELKLESGSTYSFVVSDGKPLTFKNVPYKPFKLTMENINEGPVIIKSSVFYNSELPLSDWNNNTLSIGEKGKVVKYKDLLYTCIWSLVFRSDIIQGNLKNRQYIETEGGTYYPKSSIIYPNDRTNDVINMSLACTKITKDDLSITESN